MLTVWRIAVSLFDLHSLRRKESSLQINWHWFFICMFKCIWSLLLLPNYKLKNPWMWWYVSYVFLCSTSVLLYLYTIFWLLLFVSWQRRGPVRWWCRKRRFPEMWVCDSVDFMSAQQAWQKHLLMVSLCPAGKDVPHRWLLCNWNDRRQLKQSKQWWVDIVLDYLLVLCLASLLGKVIVSMPTCTISRSPFFLFCHILFFWLPLCFHARCTIWSCPVTSARDVGFLTSCCSLLFSSWRVEWWLVDILVQIGKIRSLLHKSDIWGPFDCLTLRRTVFWCGFVFLPL
jgi:hypothetical protein